MKKMLVGGIQLLPFIVLLYYALLYSEICPDIICGAGYGLGLIDPFLIMFGLIGAVTVLWWRVVKYRNGY